MKDRDDNIKGPAFYSFEIIKQSYQTVLGTDISITETDGTYTFSWTVDTQDICGIVRIDLYDGDVLFGRIFVIDMGMLHFSSMEDAESSETILESGAVFSISSGQDKMTQEPSISVSDDGSTLAIRLINVRTKDRVLMSSGKRSFTFSLFDNAIREMLTDTYNRITVKTFGNYTSVWHDYLIRVHNFDEIDGNTAVLRSSGKPLRLIFSQTIISVE